KLVDALDVEMGEAYPELRKAVPVIKDVILTEENNFKQMLDRGLGILEQDLSALGESKVLSGETAFKLYDTYGFPLDLTQDILRQKGMTVDEVGFESALNKQKEMSKAHWKGSGETADDKIWFELKEKYGSTKFLGYDNNECQATVLAFVNGWAVFDQTVCYPEGGGQIGDQGEWNGVVILDTRKMADGIIAHKMLGGVGVGQTGIVKFGYGVRKETAKHHTATHLLQASLQRVVGNHIAQKGSKVESTRFTFDFSHGKALTAEEIDAIEADVNDKIGQGFTVHVNQDIAKSEAEKYGAMALFGEKYGETVRVIKIGGLAISDLRDKSDLERAEDVKQTTSIELCGGTHVKNTANIGFFKILSDSSIASGVRRVEAVVGRSAYDFIKQKLKLIDEIAEAAKANAVKNNKDQFMALIHGLVQQNKALNIDFEKANIQVCIL
ncbi:MAG: alanine--tRNA ligase, partial [Chlamydiae bacterium]|nr:alanine--tRNA ligase [Chlamydiota bacterium]